MTNPEFENTMLDHVAGALADSTGLSLRVDARELKAGASQDHARLDALVTVDNGRDKWRFPVEIKSRLTSASLGATAVDLTRLKSKHGPAALVTGYVNPIQAHRLRELEVQFMDTVGNVFLRRNGLYVFVSGRKPPAPLREARPSRLFNATGCRVIFSLLCQPGLEDRPYREVAANSGVSVGAVSWIMNDLIALHYMAEGPPGHRRLLNKQDLLRHWVEAYAERLRPTLWVGRYSTLRPHGWWSNAKLPAGAFWSGEIGGEILTGYLRPQTVTIYGQRELARIQAQYGLHRDDRGNVELLRGFWRLAEWQGKERHVVPPLLVYADLLMTADERNIETAKIVYDRFISRLVE